MDNKGLDLLEIRDQIDGIDKEIVELFEKRMQLSADVAEYKISNNKAVLDPQREKEKLNTLEHYASNSFNRVGVYELFRQMMAMSRKLQYRILAENGKAEKIPFRKVSSLPMQKAKVVFQGVEGAYSFTAMHSFFGESIENYNVETWRDAMEAIKNGACIVTDTQMAKSGINKRALARYGGEVYCFMSDEDVAKIAKENGSTRATASMDKAAGLDKKLIFAIGNAPTALVRLYELIEEKKLDPKLIIGVPVGFVNVVQSKELIMHTDVPYIVARGRKGGSNIAACICNALLYMIDNNRG